ncbi:MAG: UDP-N-acetylmuramoyl-tripeptide--D-alanyl-D-alanine ligase, partial [Succinivibrio sp.]|nr:UDP-N-acetylmuramoyl-tripeptide--D-alanyl-D-alanine ligase [Succinivibrio sp.]
MIEFKLSELAVAAQGTVRGGNVTVKAVSTDSRNCRGALFIALRGERFDGHDFLKNAIDNGAVALGICNDPVALSRCEALTVPVLACSDTVRLLGLCGKLVRESADCKVLS